MRHNSAAIWSLNSRRRKFQKLGLPKSSVSIIALRSPQLLRRWYRSPKGHRSRKQLVGRLGCALLAMLQNSTDFPCSHGIREVQIFEPKPVHFEPVGLKGGYPCQPSIFRGQPRIPRGVDPLRRPGHGSLLPAIGTVEIDVAKIHYGIWYVPTISQSSRPAPNNLLRMWPVWKRVNVSRPRRR